MSINIIKQLRDETGASIQKCKLALEQSNYDIPKAKEALKAMKESTEVSVVAGEGSLFAERGLDDKSIVVLSVSCQTDFVAINERFREICSMILNEGITRRFMTIEEYQERLDQEMDIFDEYILANSAMSHSPDKNGAVEIYMHHNNKRACVVSFTTEDGNITVNQRLFARKLGAHITAMNPEYLEPPHSVVLKLKEDWEEEMASMNKPPEIKAKIIEGKLSGWKKNNVLGYQEFFDGSKKIVNDLLEQNKMTVVEYVNYIV